MSMLISSGVNPNTVMGPTSAPEEYHALSLCQSPLHLAVNSTWNVTPPKREEIIVFLLDNGADLSIVDVNGDSPLVRTCLSENRISDFPLLISAMCIIFSTLPLAQNSGALFGSWLVQAQIQSKKISPVKQQNTSYRNGSNSRISTLF